MANPDQVAKLQEGVNAWNGWREQLSVPNQPPDLRGADLGGANLRGANLRGANLRGVNLVGADLGRAELGEVDLREADLVGVNLGEANLCGANLCGANLRGVNLVEADLRRADLVGVDLRGADLVGANLCEANLRWANLSGANLRGANLSWAELGETVLSAIDLAAFCGVKIRHSGPSQTDHRSIAMSLRTPGLARFLVACGMSQLLVDYTIDCLRALDPDQLFRLMRSTFISYGGPDLAFAEKLNNALLENGVTTFFFQKDAEPGAKLHRVMREGVNKYDRVILVCSEASLDRKGVLNEIQETLAREARDGGAEYFIPITLDDYLFTRWAPKDPTIKQSVLDRVVADFRATDERAGMDDAARSAAKAKFEEQLSRLLRALRILAHT
jgi:hypothetical protein